MSSPLRSLLEVKLGGDLDALVKEARGTDPPTSWRQIARDLYDVTGITVTDETLRVWYGS